MKMLPVLIIAMTITIALAMEHDEEESHFTIEKELNNYSLCADIALGTATFIGSSVGLVGELTQAPALRFAGSVIGMSSGAILIFKKTVQCCQLNCTNDIPLEDIERN